MVELRGDERPFVAEPRTLAEAQFFGWVTWVRPDGVVLGG